MKSLAEQFLDFCRSKPADETYNIDRADVCAFAQFAEAIGLPNPERRDLADVPEPIRGALYPTDDTESMFVGTFGALATRLEEALTDA